MKYPLQKNVLFILLLTFLCFASIHFLFVAIQGENGHLRRMKLEIEEKRLLGHFNKLEKERFELENKIFLLSDDSLDLDLLDERARAILGMARLDDVIIR